MATGSSRPKRTTLLKRLSREVTLREPRREASVEGDLLHTHPADNKKCAQLCIYTPECIIMHINNFQIMLKAVPNTHCVEIFKVVDVK